MYEAVLLYVRLHVPGNFERGVETSFCAHRKKSSSTVYWQSFFSVVVFFPSKFGNACIDMCEVYVLL